MRIIIASGNQNKINEISDIFARHANNLQIYSIKDQPIPEPDEPYHTFMENACHKAKYYAAFTKLPTLSEDAGLCIRALRDFPGVQTKDFVEECGSLSHAFATLENKLHHQDKAAFFICAAALYLPGEDRFITYEAKDHGKITFPARGEHGFGFDPIFVPNGYMQTMAELGNEVKNAIGHRALAMQGIIAQLN